MPTALNVYKIAISFQSGELSQEKAIERLVEEEDFQPEEALNLLIAFGAKF